MKMQTQLPPMSDPVWSEEDRQRASELLLRPDAARFRKEMLVRFEAARARHARRARQARNETA
jgi:hypothetical protein